VTTGKTSRVSETREVCLQIRNTAAKQSMVTVTYVHLVGERWLIKTSSGRIARAANREGGAVVKAASQNQTLQPIIAPEFHKRLSNG
jgi:hypothetical protein